MRYRLQLACQLLFLSTIASSAQTPPRTTDATINENQSVENSVEDWFLSNFLEETMEDTITLYPHLTAEANIHPTVDATGTDEHQATGGDQSVEDSVDDWFFNFPISNFLDDSVEDAMTWYPHLTAEANIHPTVDATGTDEHQATVGEAWKYPTEGSSDANQSVEASMEGGTTMYQHATAETTRPVTKYASTKYAMEVSSFQTAASNNVPLEYQDTLEANQVPTIEEAWMDQDEDRVEDWMTVYQPPTAEVNHHLTIGATSTNEDQAELDEALKRAMEGSSDANQSFEASVEDETSRGCIWCKTTASKWHRGPGGVRLCNTCGNAWSRNGVLPSGGMLRKRRRRIVPPASGMCIQCKTLKVKKWRRGPDGVSNLCDSCGNDYSEFKKNYAFAQRENAGLRLERSNEQMPFDVSVRTNQVQTIGEAWEEDRARRKERKRVLEEKKANQAEKEGKGVVKQRRQPNQNFVQGSSDANQSVEASVEDVTAMYRHATAETSRPRSIDATWAVDEAWKYALEGSSFQIAETNDVPLDYQNTVKANQAQTIQAWLDQEQATVDVDAPSMLAILVPAVNTFPVAHTPQRLPPSSDPMIAASNFPTLQTRKPLSMHPVAILSRKRRARDRLAADATSFPGIPTLQTYASLSKISMSFPISPLTLPYISCSKPLSTHPKAIYFRERRALETPQKHTARLAKVKAYKIRKAEERARVQATPPTNQTEGESSQKKSKS